MTNTTKRTRPVSATGRAIIHTSKGRNNTKPSRKQRLLAFKSRAVNEKIRARKSPNDIPSVRIDGGSGVIRAKLLAYQKSSRRAGGGGPRHEPEPIEIHDLAKLPEMSAKEYAELRDDIARNGLMEPIILHEGKILDGYHRSKACCELGLPREIETYKGTDPAGFVLSRNAYRRHLTADQRTALITKLRGPQLKAEAQVRMKAHQFRAESTRENTAALKSAQPERVAEQIAKESGVGRDKARKAIRLLETKPEVLDEVIIGRRKKLPAEPKKPRKPKPPVDKLAHEFIWAKFGQFLKRHWPSHADQRKVREHLRAQLSP